MRSLDELSAIEILYWAAVAEKRSEHPLAKAVIKRAEELGLNIPHPDSFENFRGKGVKAHWNSKTIIAGSPEMLRGEGLISQNHREGFRSRRI